MRVYLQPASLQKKLKINGDFIPIEQGSQLAADILDSVISSGVLMALPDNIGDLCRLPSVAGLKNSDIPQQLGLIVAEIGFQSAAELQHKNIQEARSILFGDCMIAAAASFAGIFKPDLETIGSISGIVKNLMAKAL